METTHMETTHMVRSQEHWQNVTRVVDKCMSWLLMCRLRAIICFTSPTRSRAHSSGLTTTLASSNLLGKCQRFHRGADIVSGKSFVNIRFLFFFCFLTIVVFRKMLCSSVALRPISWRYESSPRQHNVTTVDNIGIVLKQASKRRPGWVG